MLYATGPNGLTGNDTSFPSRFLPLNVENAESIEPVRGIGGVVRRDLPVESKIVKSLEKRIEINFG